MPSVLAGLWLCFGLTIIGSRFDSFRVRSAAFAALLLALIVLGRAVHRGWRPRFSIPLAVLLGIQGFGIVLASLSASAETRLYTAGTLLVLTGVGWLAFVEMRASGARDEGADIVEPVPQSAILLLPVLAVLAMALAFHETLSLPLISSVDEMLYRMQARMLAGGAASFAVAPDLIPLFQLPDVAYSPNSIVPQSAPGWPLVLAAAVGGGIESGLAVALTVANVLLTAFIGRRIFGHLGGLLAAMFVAVNPIILRYGPTWHPHAATLTLLLLATLMLLLALENARSPGQRLCLQVGAGAVLALALLMRPFTAVALAIAIIAWTHLRTDLDVRERRVSLFRVVAGSLTVLLVWQALDAWYFGTPLRSGHQPSGLVGGGALESAAELMKASWFSFGAAGLFATAGLLIHFRIRPAASASLPFLLLPVWNFASRGSDVRLYYELIPFAGLAFAWAMLEVHRRAARAATAFSALTLGGALAVSCLLLASFGRVDSAPRDLHALVEHAVASHGRILVIVPARTSSDVMAQLWGYNITGLDGPVVVARDAGSPATSQLLDRYRDRRQVVLLRVGEDRWMLWPVTTATELAGHNRIVRTGARPSG